MSEHSTTKEDSPIEKDLDLGEKGISSAGTSLSEELENSPIEAVRLAVPITDDPTLPVITFRFWLISFFFTALGATIQQYYIFRSTYGTFSIFFVNLVSYSIGRFLARVLPTRKLTLFGEDFSLNPGAFNIKEHCLIGVAVSTGSMAAYGIDIIAAADLYLGFRINVLGSLLILITTQCCGFGMAGMLRKYLVYPSEMVWYGDLVQVVFYNTMHNTTTFKDIRLVRGWTRMKFFWVVASATFVYQFIPQWLAPILVYFDWLCWFKPFDKNFWVIFSSLSGPGVGSLSFDWTSIGGSSMYLPLSAQLCSLLGIVLYYWIFVPTAWLTNAWDMKRFGRPLTSRLFYEDATPFNINDFLNDDFTLNETLYEAGRPATISPLYAIGFLFSFVTLAASVSHVALFHGPGIWKRFRQSLGSKDEDVHRKLMRAYPEVPQYWYAILYVLMATLACLACTYYGTQLPWYGLLAALLVGWVFTLPIGVMSATTGYGPSLNAITELICGYLFPGKPIANVTFKCYGYMSMYQCTQFLADLKLAIYMKIPPKAMFIAQLWGTSIGVVFNYLTMLIIINTQRGALDGTTPDPKGLWTGQRILGFWGSGLIYGALGPARIFSSDGRYWFVFLGFAFGLLGPLIIWTLSKVFPKYQWQKINISILAGGMGAYANGYLVGILPGIIVATIFQGYIFRYRKEFWKKYVYILSAGLDTGAAFTGLVMFLFLGGGITPNLAVKVPSWWGNHYVSDDPSSPNAPFLGPNRCGAAHGAWTSGA